MNGVSVAIANPIDPITPEDVRPSVKALIAEHRVKIDKIKGEISSHSLYDANKHDDLWILRYWLSHKKTKKAVAAAFHTLEYRQKYNLDEQDIRHDTPHLSSEPRVAEYWQKRCQGDGIVCAIPDKQRGVLMFIKFAQMDPNASKTLTTDVWDYAFIYSSEWSHQWLDYVTRTTGRLTKSIRFIDMQNLSITKSFDRESNKRDGKIMNYMEDCYPQLLETIYACNPPEWMHLIWAIMRPIMPKRILDKVDVVQPERNAKEGARFFKHVSKKDLPAMYGGDNPVLPTDWKC